MAILKRRMVKFKAYVNMKNQPDLIQTFNEKSVFSMKEILALVYNNGQSTRKSILTDILLHIEDNQLLDLLLHQDKGNRFHGTKINLTIILPCVFSSPVVCLCHGFMSVVDRAPCSRWCLCRA